MYLLSFPGFWTLSIERFWFLFWSILYGVTLKTSNMWFVKHRIIIFIEVFVILCKLEGSLFIVIHESKGETPFRKQGRIPREHYITKITFNFEKMLYRFLNFLNLSPDLFISSWTQKKKKQKQNVYQYWCWILFSGRCFCSVPSHILNENWFLTIGWK